MAVTSTRAERQHSHSEHLRCSSPPATHHWRDSVFLALGANVHTRFASCIVGTWPCETPVVMYGCKSWDYKEGWMLKNWCFQIVVLEKILESPLDSKETNIWGWIFTGRTNAEVEALILRPPDVKSWLTGKDPDAGTHWGQEKEVTKDKMVGWHDQLNGHEFNQTPGDNEGQGSLVCYSPWGHKEDTT